jgi:uncharacterized protein (TIGR02099 family)
MEPTIFTPSALPSRRIQWLARAMSVTLWLLVTAWLLLALGWSVLHGWIVPRIGEFRPRLEIAAGKALGVPVRIGQITAKSEGVLPLFELADVRLLDARGQVALRLPRISGVLTPASLWGLGFEQLLIEQPELDVRRASDGQFYVGGLPVSERKDTGDGTAVDWIFSQPELVIRGGTVRWTDEMRQAPSLALTNVNWVLRNGRHRHSIRLDATPPADLGDRFSLRGNFRQPLLSSRAGDFNDWSGQMYGEVTRTDLGRITQYADFQKLGITLASGNGALRAWADVKDGQLVGGLADVALQGVEARLGSQLDALAFDSVSGRIGGARRVDGFNFNTENLRFRTRDGLQWPGGNMALSHTSREGQRAEHTELTADRLDLAALAQIASRLPLGPETHTRIQSFAPSGLVETVKARWQGPLESLQTFAVSGRVSALSLAGGPPGIGGQAPNKHETPGRPGLTGGAVDFEVTQDGGRAQIKISDGSVDFPGVFEEPRVPFDKLAAEATWKVTGRSVDVKVRNLQFSNADAEGQAQVSWRTDDSAAATLAPAQSAASKSASVATADQPDRRFPGVLDLQGTLTRGNGARVHRYLPLVMAEPVRRYVREAVTAGAVSDVNFKVKGPVNDIPYTNPALGEFRVTAKVRDGQYAFVPRQLQPANALPWPALTDLNGELVFMRAALEVNNASGKVAGLPGVQLVKANAKIPDLLKNATVDVNLEAKGPVSDALAFVNTSPLLDITSQALAKTIASGPADYRFRLSLPINAIATSRVEGTVTLAGVDAQFAPATPGLTNIRGTVGITERGFNVNGAQARMLGGDVRVDGGLQPARAGEAEPAAVAFKAEGTLSADGLRQLKDIGMVSRLAQNASGTAAYTASLAFRKGTTEVSVSSNLQGMALSLPAPLAKAAEAALPVRFENTLLTDSLKPGQALQDRLALTIGNLVGISYLRDISGAQPRVIRGSIGIGLEAGETAQLPESGVAANINLAQVNLDAWEKILEGATSAPAAGATPTVPAAAGTGSAAMALGYLPTTMAIRAKELNVQGRKLHNVVVGGSRDGLNWRANIDASELNGYVEFRQPGGSGGGRVYARLARLSLAPATANEVEALLDEQPANIPALDIVVDDLELRGKQLGRVEIDAVNRGVSLAAREGAREWRLNKLNVTMPEAVLTANGSWAVPSAAEVAALPVADRPTLERRRTHMNFRLDVTDSGELLRRFGKGDLIRRGKGRLEGQIGWAGSPLSLDYPSLGGQFNVSMESGQFVKADPGIAKLLGVLSLQSLPRRLTLDFRDVFSEGFAFDFVRGDVNIRQGIAQTNNLQMSGVNAAVLMEGRADISRETQDLKVVVVPEINAGTASLIATVINPAIGLGTFLAQLFLRRPLMEAATQEFHVDGTWADPKITKIDRRAAARAAENNPPAVTR